MGSMNRLLATRWGTLIAALLAALAASLALLVYLNRYRAEVREEGTPVTVLVASQNIPKGTSGSVIASRGLYTASTIREGQLKEGAISDPASLRGLATTDEVFEGAQLTEKSFAPAKESLPASLTGRKRIMAVPLDSAHGLIANIEVGNRVDVFAGFTLVTAGASTKPVLRRIVADVPIIGIEEGKVERRNATSNLLIRLSDADAAKIAFASDYGKIWFALRPSAGAKASPPDLVTVETLMLGIPPIQMVRAMGGVR